jgi:2-dehydro-3-deoxy-L-rhamnonate dehydrogenase (NAD+)
MQDLRNRISVVTGGAMGIGKAIALRLASDGSDVAIVDIAEESGTKTATEIQAMGRKGLFLKVDVTQWNPVDAMVGQVLGTFGRLDILVNCAGILGPEAPIWEYSIEDWDRVMNINMRGVFLCCRAGIIPMLKQRSGRIVNIASISGKEGIPKLCAYSASKAAVIAFTKVLAREVVKENIIVNSIAPAQIETDLLLGMTSEKREMLRSTIPMGRSGKPHEVAALVKFLVSDECSFTTGQCFDLSGGRAVY